MPSRAHRHSSTSGISVAPSATVSSSVISPFVSVPVLSIQTTLVRASDSIPYSSLTSALRLPSLTTPAASATEVSRINPSGIIPNTEATVAVTVSSMVMSSAERCFQYKNTPMGTMAMDTYLIIRFISRISSLLARFTRRADS